MRTMRGPNEALEGGPSVFASIVIPTFNPGDLIVQTLRSCLGVNGVDLEIIVVDDGSTDGTLEMIERDFPGVLLHRIACNSGSGSLARNAGLALASGRYVKFLDHDDLIQPRGFKRECQEASHSNADIIMARWGVVQIEEMGRFKQSAIQIISPPEPSRLVEAILRGESVPFTAAALYKKSFIAAEAWDPTFKIIDDFDWFCRMAIKAGDVRKVDSIAYYWRQHDRSLQGKIKQAGTIHRNIVFERYRVHRKLESQLQAKGLLEGRNARLLADRYYAYLKWCARYNVVECKAVQDRIYRHDPDFVVNPACEPGRLSLWLIRRFGLAFYLWLYHWSVRLLRR